VYREYVVHPFFMQNCTVRKSFVRLKTFFSPSS
jgi:hypothetical protein